MKPKVVTSEKDLQALEFGDSFIVEVPGLPDHPIKLVESKQWAEVLRLRDLAADRFRRPTKDGTDSPAETENGEAENGGSGHPKEENSGGESEEVEDGGPAESDDVVSVSFTESHMTIKAIEDVFIRVTGDVRDFELSMKAGKSTRRKLTGEGFGWVSINDQRFEVPK